jgi:thymidylate synthase
MAIHEEEQYLHLIKQILEVDHFDHGRNGHVKSIFGCMMKFNLKDNVLPVLTTKKVAIKTCLKELLWFISGKTDNKILKKNKVNIWNANGSREFLDSRQLTYKEDDLGPVYGHQWRFFNAPYVDCETDYTGQGVDQLKYIINNLKDVEKRKSRRLIMSAWNPLQIDEMALPPCHVLAQFNVTGDNKLDCALYQRSGDVGLGVPFNIASYALLTHIIAHHTGLEANQFTHFIGNAHIYEEHIEPLKTQLDRKPFEFPKLIIKQTHDNINDYIVDDFDIIDYKYHDKIAMKMKA